jgi:hypothetical protein
MVLPHQKSRALFESAGLSCGAVAVVVATPFGADEKQWLYPWHEQAVLEQMPPSGQPVEGC